MEFNELQDRIMQNAIRYGKKHNIKIDQNFALLKLFEEMGELAQAVLIHQKKSRAEKFLDEEQSKEKLAEELADVAGMAIVNAKLFNIDLERIIRKKWLKEDIK